LKILVCTDDRLGRSMAGSALRTWEMARALAGSGFEVCIEAAPSSSPPGEGPEIVREGRRFRPDVLITPPWSFRPVDLLTRTMRVVLDGVTPLPAELDAMPDTPEVLRRRRRAVARLPLALARADALLVAGAAQRKWWLQQLGRRRPELPIVDFPFGVPGKPTSGEVRSIPGVPPENAVVLWWGGVWPWLDLETLLAARAMMGGRKLSVVVPVARRPGSISRVFGPEDLEAAMRRHGLRHPEVVGLEDWVAYGERDALLMRASVLAVLHHPGAEAELSFRTRAMDGLWAGVPLLLTEGGEVAGIARSGGWGAVVPPEEPGSVAAALDLLLSERHQLRCREALEHARPHWVWERLAESLVGLLPGLPLARRGHVSIAALRTLKLLFGGRRERRAERVSDVG